MNNNRFYENRHAIASLAKKLGLDADSASVKFAKDNGWTNFEAELKEWRTAMRNYQLSKGKTLADLFK